MTQYSTYSDYLNHLIEDDLEIPYVGTLLEEGDSITIEEEKAENHKTICKKVTMKYFKHLEDIKRQVVYIFYHCTYSPSLRDMLLQSVIDQINCFLGPKKVITPTIDKILKELRDIREALEKKEEETYLKLCNITQREKSMLYHLMLKYGMDARAIFDKYGVSKYGNQ